MPRTSPVHYIAPSAVTVTPNCNGSADDLAVSIAAGTTIKVYDPRIAGLGVVDSSYQEWTLAGRNRRLAKAGVPYTIYARLNKSSVHAGYLVFAAQVRDEEGVWHDPYVLSPNTSSTEGMQAEGADGNTYSWEPIPEGQDKEGRSGYWWVKAGTVSLPDSGGLRSVDLDTGILGTDQYDNGWSINPDSLPLRVELRCSAGGEDAGQAPYVYWGDELVLTATLREGWSGAASERFDHWRIARNTGDADADAAWPGTERASAFKPSGSITLSHARGASDDFNAAVAASFTVSAMGKPEQQGGDPVLLAEAGVTIYAETVERYELLLSTSIVSYSPKEETYNPQGGVSVRVRATDQRSSVFDLTCQQFTDMALSLWYAPVDGEEWTALEVSGSPGELATASIPVSAFAPGKSINVRLARTAGQSTSELARATVAFVRDGEDSPEREWIFFRSQEEVAFGDAQSDHPEPSLIASGETDPAAAAAAVTTDKNQDGWVPQGWWDEQQGVDETYRYEYGSYRDYLKDSAQWGDFTTPRIWGHYGADGENALHVEIIGPNIIKNGVGEVTLTAYAYDGEDDVTGTLQDAAFSWERTSLVNPGDYAESDEQFNLAHEGIGRSLTIDQSSIMVRAHFQCVVNYLLTKLTTV